MVPRVLPLTCTRQGQVFRRLHSRSRKPVNRYLPTAASAAPSNEPSYNEEHHWASSNTKGADGAADGAGNPPSTSKDLYTAPVSAAQGTRARMLAPAVRLMRTMLAALIVKTVVRKMMRYVLLPRRLWLRRLRRLAQAQPEDSRKQDEYMRALVKCNKPRAAIARFESGKVSTGAGSVAAYLHACALIGRLSKYDSAGQASGLQPLPKMLEDLKARAEGSTPSSPGTSSKAPLHVAVVQGDASGKGPLPLRAVKELSYLLITVVMLSVAWVGISTALRKPSNSKDATSGSQSYSTAVNKDEKGSSSSSFAPKEFSKESIPQGSIKSFNDVKGCDEAKTELHDIVSFLKDPEKFQKLGGKLPKGVLLTGSPGTGKTLLAKAVAGEAGVPFLYRAGSEFEEVYVGVGSRRVRSLFSTAKKKQPCIVFIDELDAIGGSRRSWDAHGRKTLNQMLVEMDGFESSENVVVIAATNAPDTLDSALTRPGRFDRHIHVPNPDIGGRREILTHYLHDKPVDSSVDIETIARGTTGFTGADLNNLVNTAAVQGALEGEEKLTARLMDWARDRLILGSERKSAVLSEENRKLTAYHEGSHALVAMNTPGARPVHKCTIVPRGSALGITSQLPDKDETSVSKKELLARLDVCMGGKIGEELVFGQENVTTGASNDLQQATSIARHMVEECGMGARTGPLFTTKEGDLKVSPETQRMVDAEVGDMLRESYNRVRSLLSKHMDELHTLASALLDRETLTADEMRSLLRTSSTSELPQPAEHEAIAA